MTILFAVIAAVIIAAVAVSVALLIRHTTITVVIRKDPDMDTIKQRIAALEADNATLKAQLADHGATLTNAATVDDLSSVRRDVSSLTSGIDAVTTRVADVEAEIGTDPIPAPAVDPVVAQDPAFAPTA